MKKLVFGKLQKIKRVLFFSTGKCEVYGMNGKRIVKLEESWANLFCKNAIENGYDPSNTEVQFALNNGKNIEFVNRGDRWEWE